MFSRKAILRSVFIIFLLIVFLCVALQLGLLTIRWSGDRKWVALRGELLAKGEKLMLSDYEQPSIPEEENFFGGPLWIQPAQDAAQGREKPRLPIEELLPPVTDEELATLKARHPETRWNEKADRAKRGSVLLGVNPKANEPPDVRRRQAALALDLLDPAQPYLTALETAAVRPKSWYPLDYQSHYDLAVPYITPMIGAAQIFTGRAKARLELGDSSGAFTDARTLLLLEKHLDGQPTLICWLVKASVLEMFLGVIQRGLELHAWSDEELAFFDRQLAGLDLTPGFLFALRTERGTFNQCINYITSTAKQKSGKDVRSYFGHDQALFNRLMQEWIVRVEAGRTEGFSGQPTIEIESAQLEQSKTSRYFHFLTLLTAPSLSSVESRFLELQNRVEMTRVACALERWRLEKGDYPEALSALSPAYLEPPPVDAVDRAPFKYRRTAEGKYQLYSVALNRQDDGGVARENLDWVWGIPRERTKSAPKKN